jgi:hypothetical protein
VGGSRRVNLTENSVRLGHRFHSHRRRTGEFRDCPRSHERTFSAYHPPAACLPTQRALAPIALKWERVSFSQKTRAGHLRQIEF